MVPMPLLHNLKTQQCAAPRIVLLRIVIDNIPRVPHERRIEVAHLGDNFHAVTARYGFMRQPNIPRALEECGARELHFAMMALHFLSDGYLLSPTRTLV